MKCFVLERDHYSTPQVLIVVADSLEEAEKILEEKYKSENKSYFSEKKSSRSMLKEVSLGKAGLHLFEPPGDRHLIR